MTTRVTTETGSTYLIDYEAQTMRRTQGAISDPLRHDDEEIRYEAISPIVRGVPLYFFWVRDEGIPVLRSTSPVMEVS